MPSKTFILVLGICLYYKMAKGNTSDKRLLSSSQSDFDAKFKQLESIVNTLQQSLSEEQLKVQQLNTTINKLKESSNMKDKKILDLEAKANSSVQHMVGFSACHTLSASLGGGQTVIYNQVITNAGNAYNDKDGEFRAPYAGLYTFTVVGMANQRTDLYLNLMRNGNFVNQLYSDTSYADTSTLTINLYLQAGDEVWIVNGSQSVHKLNPGNYNCFSGMLVREG